MASDTRPPILVADDDAGTRTRIRVLLESWGHVVRTVKDGEAALAAFEESAPQIAILDWIMPGLSGPEVCRRIRRAPQAVNPYILLLTVRDRRTDLLEGLEAGADEYLVKPVDPSELRARIGVGKRISGLQARLADRIVELETALEQVRTLEGLIPICMYCKKVRTGDAYWEQVEGYVSARTDAVFSHGICPECMERVEAELDRGDRSGEGR